MYSARLIRQEDLRAAFAYPNSVAGNHRPASMTFCKRPKFGLPAQMASRARRRRRLNSFLHDVLSSGPEFNERLLDLGLLPFKIFNLAPDLLRRKFQVSLSAAVISETVSPSARPFTIARSLVRSRSE